VEFLFTWIAPQDGGKNGLKLLIKIGQDRHFLDVDLRRPAWSGSWNRMSASDPESDRPGSLGPRFTRLFQDLVPRSRSRCELACN
jgi:hypothetical protein